MMKNFLSFFKGTDGKKDKENMKQGRQKRNDKTVIYNYYITDYQVVNICWLGLYCLHSYGIRVYSL